MAPNKPQKATKKVAAGPIKPHTSFSNIAVKPYICKYCGKDFKLKRCLPHHLAQSTKCRDELIKDQAKLKLKNLMAKHSYEIILDPTVILDHEIPFIPDNKSIESTDSSNTTQRSEDNLVCNRNNMPSFDQLLYFETKLLQILNDGNAPLYLYKKIIEWTLELCQSNVAVDQLLKTREAVIKQIESKIPFLKKTKSYQKEVLLSTDDTPQAVNVTVFDFKSQLLSLINHSSLFNDLDNLDVNPKNRFGKYKSENHTISSVNSGNRYELTYNTLINDPEKDFLMPIIFACDETKVSSQGKALVGHYCSQLPYLINHQETYQLHRNLCNISTILLCYYLNMKKKNLQNH